SLSQSLSQS
nr:Chain B, Oligopeptide [synthetic construct]